MTLGDSQRKFTRLVGLLIGWSYAAGYELSLGEALRTKAQAEANAASGAGISNSLHLLRLAIDLQLFKDGVYLTDTESYRPLGIYWESLGGSWGGRFSKPDGNHFSLAYQGVR